jgi:hypothetical protein
MDTPREIVAALVANALDDIETERLDVAAALRMVAEAVWCEAVWGQGPPMRQPVEAPSNLPAAV